jgi:hypothetical protein
MARALEIDLDMHRIGEAVSGMVTGRNFEDAVCTVHIAAQDAQTGRPLRHAQRSSNIGGRGHSLNILRDLDELDFGKPLNLAKDCIFAGINLVRDAAHCFMNKSFGVGERLARITARAQPSKPGPSAASDQANLFSDGAGQGSLTKCFETRPCVSRILKDFGHVGERLVQGAAPGSSRLDNSAGPSLARNQTLGLKRTQRLSHGKAAHTVSRAQYAFGGKNVSLIGPAQNFFAQVVGQFLVTRFRGQIFPPVAAVAPA